MALIKCVECGKEISVTVDVCPNCGSKKPFKGIVLTKERTKELTYKERKKFEKTGGKTTAGTFEKIGSFIFAVIILLFMYSMIKPESAEKIQKDMEQLSITIKNIPSIKIEDNYNGYKQLSKYYPKNEEYQEKLSFYKSRYEMMGICQFKAIQNNKATLNNPTTYNDNTFDKYLAMNWNNVNQYEFQSSFSGKNAFGVEQKFVAKYMCDYNNGNIKMKRIFLKKALD